MTKTPHDARATLEKLDAALRRAEDLHWTDPEFLKWERNQFLWEGQTIVALASHWTELGINVTRYTPRSGRYGSHPAPMIWLITMEKADPYQFFGWEAEKGNYEYNSVEPDPVFGYRYTDPVGEVSF